MFNSQHSFSITKNKSLVKRDETATGEILDDWGDKWQVEKMASIDIATLYALLHRHGDRLVSANRIWNIMGCGSWLHFGVTFDESGKMQKYRKKLKNANFCRARMCPMCSWRRSLRIFSDTSRCLPLFGAVSYLLITLTVKNCSGDALKEEVGQLGQSFNRLSKYKEWQSAILGYQRTLEVTYNRHDKTYHPHLHILAVVDGRTYFRKDHNKYITQERLVQLWRRAAQLDYDPLVGITRVEATRKAGAVAEVSKYPLKAIDILAVANKDRDEGLEVLKTMHNALKSVRMITWGGLFKKVRQQLKLQDAEDENADLVNISDEDEAQKAIYKYIEVYSWLDDVKNYVNTAVIPADEYEE